MRLVTTPLLLLSLTLAGSAHAAAGVETGAEFEALCLSPDERDRRACQLVIEVIRAMDGFQSYLYREGALRRRVEARLYRQFGSPP